ncbi:NUDIX domain-containing protein [Candidatus Woesearchaeota archaeon]|nr:NUDIX domain-containing protein [Candidatus Woesearchaeota archaeon]
MAKTYFVVTGIVMHNGKLLILKKSDDDRNYPGCWGFCSGFVKEFEAAEDTVLREIKEETGLDASITKEGGLIKVKDAALAKNWAIMAFLCSAADDKVGLDHENSEYKWITREEIGNYKFVPGLIEDLKSVGII